jgi:glycosyltransferase involved in cell wall biosynthesis
MASHPKVILLKQTAPDRIYFMDLARDLASEIGSSIAVTSEATPGHVGDLTVLSGPAYRRSSAFARLWTWARYFLYALWVTTRTGRNPLLFIVAQPPYLPLIGYLRNLILRQPYVVWVDDVYPDVLVRMGRIRAGGIIDRAWRWFNRRIYGRAAAVFTLAPHMAELVQRDSRQPVAIVPTWADVDAFPAVAKDANAFAQQHDQTSKVTVMYSGNIGATHDLGAMLQAASDLKDHENISFMIVGGGPRWGEVERQSRTLPNVTCLPYQPEADLAYSLATADIAVVALASGLEGISMPSKTYTNMAARSAILSISRSPNDLQNVVDTHHCGINVEPGDSAAFAAAVLRFADTPDYLATCRRNARAAAENAFSRTVNVKAVLDIVRPLVKS